MSIALITIPKIAVAHIIPNNVQPIAPLREINVNGVYVPAISKKIVQWSKIRITRFALFGLKL